MEIWFWMHVWVWGYKNKRSAGNERHQAHVWFWWMYAIHAVISKNKRSGHVQTWHAETQEKRGDTTQQPYAHQDIFWNTDHSQQLKHTHNTNKTSGRYFGWRTRGTAPALLTHVSFTCSCQTRPPDLQQCRHTCGSRIYIYIHILYILPSDIYIMPLSESMA